MADMADMDEMTERGRVTWMSSDPDSGPDCGTSVGLGNGSMLLAGEVTRRLWTEAPDAHHLGDDTGTWLILYHNGEASILGKTADAETGSALIEIIRSALALPS